MISGVVFDFPLLVSVSWGRNIKCLPKDNKSAILEL